MNVLQLVDFEYSMKYWFYCKSLLGLSYSFLKLYVMCKFKFLKVPHWKNFSLGSFNFVLINSLS